MPGFCIKRKSGPQLSIRQSLCEFTCEDRAKVVACSHSKRLAICINLLLDLVACRWGRKVLFLGCGSLMAAMQIATGILTAVTFTGTKIPVTAGDVMIAFICVFVACFAASWGPLGWLVSSSFCDTVVCSACASSGSCCLVSL